MTFRVGQRVGCIKRGSWMMPTALGNVPYCYGPAPAFGEICTVIGFDQFGGLLLHGYPIPHKYPDGGDIGWHQSRFCPVQERKRKTDISIFTAMLNPSQVTVDAMNTADFAKESAG